MSATTIAIMNQKGGVGKSTIAHLLAVALARLGYNVGLVDLDTQGHQSALLGMFDDDGLPHDSIARVFEGNSIDGEWNQLVPARISKIWIPDKYLPHITTEHLQAYLYFLPGYQQTATISPTDVNQLHTLLQPLIDGCDFVILDTGPTTSNLNASALATADYLLIPMKIGVLSFMGLRDLLNIRLNLINEGLVQRADILGIIPTMVRTNTILYQELIDELRDAYGDLVWDDCTLAESVVWEEAAAYQTTVLQHVPNHSAAESAWRLVDRFIRQFDNRKEPTLE